MCKKLILPISFSLVIGTLLTSAVKADLVAYWRLDEGSGTTANDSTGNGNDGTFNGDPQWVEGYYGSAIEFDGAGDFLDCGSDPSLPDRSPSTDSRSVSELLDLCVDNESVSATLFGFEAAEYRFQYSSGRSVPSPSRSTPFSAASMLSELRYPCFPSLFDSDLL